MEVDNVAGNRNDLVATGRRNRFRAVRLWPLTRVGNGTKDPDDDRELPECFSHELIGKPPKNSSIGGVLVDLLGVKADYELPTAAYEEILYILNTALGNDRRAVGDCTTA
eukprot:jgi/Tetstr1/465503/TSEL_010172.t1